MWFSPMFKETTKVKLPCIFLAFTAVVNKERLIKIQSKDETLGNNANGATQSKCSDDNQCISIKLTNDWCLHKTHFWSFPGKGLKSGDLCNPHWGLSPALPQCFSHVGATLESSNTVMKQCSWDALCCFSDTLFDGDRNYTNTKVSGLISTAERGYYVCRIHMKYGNIHRIHFVE